LQRNLRRLAGAPKWDKSDSFREQQPPSRQSTHQKGGSINRQVAKIQKRGRRAAKREAKKQSRGRSMHRSRSRSRSERSATASRRIEKSQNQISISCRGALYISNHLKDIHFKKLPFLLFEFGTKEKKKKDKETPHAFFSRLSSLTWHLADSFFFLSLFLSLSIRRSISLFLLCDGTFSLPQVTP
jgi:hypothetical protein